jgi:hypothetical protein
LQKKSLSKRKGFFVGMEELTYHLTILRLPDTYIFSVKSVNRKGNLCSDFSGECKNVGISKHKYEQMISI